MKIYGGLETQTGINFITSGTGSLTNDVQHVGASAAGVYTIALAKADLSDASAAWYDEYVVILSATGAAYETFIVEGVRTDTSYVSNVLSNLSAILSDVYSALTGGTFTIGASNASDIASAVWAHTVGTRLDSRMLVNQSMTSDAMSAAQQGNSRIILVQSRLSDFDSRMVSDISDVLSAVRGNSDAISALRAYMVTMSGVLSDTYSAASNINSMLVAGTHQLGASNISDVASAVWALHWTGHSLASSFGSAFERLLSAASDAMSAAQQGNSRTLVVQSSASDVYSLLTAGVTLTTSAMSDIASQVWGHTVGTRVDSRLLLTQSMASDTYSLVQATGGAGLTVSNISDIASAVWALHWTGHSLASSFGSAFERIMSNASDAMSAAQQANSRILVTQSQASDIYSLVQAGVILTTSAMSDVASQVWAHTVGTRLDSRVLLNLSRISDVYSLVSDTQSDILSLLTTTGVQLNASTMSDLRSAIAGVTVTIDASAASDIASAVWGHAVGTRVDSRLLLNQSRISDVYSLLSDTQSDLLSLLTTTGVQLNASTMSDLRSAIAGVTVAIDASAASDIASAVWGHAVGTRVDSRLLLNQSRISDTYSMLSDFLSDFQSRVPKAVATNSQLSDLASDLRSFLVVMSGVLSDTYSAASNINSMLLGGTFALGASNLSDLGSAVWAQHWTGHSLASSFGSAFEKLLSAASDAASGVSDLRSLLTTTGVILTGSAMSDIASQVWGHAAGLRVDSRLLLTQSMASDAASAAQQTNSRVLLNLSRISDVYSLLSDTQSDMLSLLTTTGVQLNASSLSDLRSAIAGGAAGTLTVSDISDIASAVWATPLATKLVQLNASDLSDLRSAIGAGPAATITASDISDIASAVWATALATKLVTLNASDMSDLRSAIGAGPAATITASDVSDIASAVWAHLVGARVDSRVLLNLSRISDVYSLLSDTTSDLRSYLVLMSGMLSDTYSLASDLNSDLRSLLLAGVTLTTSAMSDVASQVWAHTVGARIDSRLLVVQSQASDVYSLLSDTNSDLRSLLTTNGVQLNASSMSDLRSAIAGVTFALGASELSDIASAVWGHPVGARVDSRLLVVQSQASDVYSLLSDTASDLRSLVTTTGVQLNASSLSDVRSAIGAITVTIGPSDVSDIASAVLAGLTGLTPSDISDIASAVRAILVSDLSDILSAARQTNSRTLVVESDTSNIYSLLTNGVTLDASTMSDVRSAITAAAVTLDTSTMSDIASQVWAHPAGQQLQSRLVVTQSQASDIYSLLGAVQADINGVSGAVHNVYGLLSSLESDIQSRFPATIPELSADPGATPTWAHAAALQYAWLKNSTKTTASKRVLRNAAGGVILSAILNDDGFSFVQGRLG